MGTFRGSGTPISGADVYDQDALDAVVTAATAQASASAASATAASTSAAAAALSEINAATSETNAAASEAAAATSETNAAASEAAAATSETNAAASEAAAALSYDSFDDRYLGPKASDPTLDNDGNALLTGALYWNTTSGNMMVYDGAAWQMLEAFPSISGNALKHLRVTAGATGLEWFDLLGSANTWTNTQTFQNLVDLSTTQPQMRFFETDTTDQNWGFRLNTGQFQIGRYNDAGSNTAQVMTFDSTNVDTKVCARVQGTGSPSSGAGVETIYQSGVGYVSSYDRDTPGYKPLHIRGDSLLFDINGTTRVSMYANSLTFTGDTAAAIAIDAPTGASPFLYFHENGGNRVRMWHDAASHYFVVRKYLDSAPGTTVTNQLLMYDSGKVVLQDAVANESFEVGTGDVQYVGKSIRSYAGQINSSGSLAFGPTGWSTSKISTGQYRVTHGVGTTQIVFTANAVGTSADYGCTIASVDANNTDIYTHNQAGTLTDVGVHFIAQKV